MPAHDSPFASLATLRGAFFTGLQRMLEADDLGAYILVCANATLDGEIYDRLRSRLRQRLEALKGRDWSGAPEDDLAVFEQLLAIGFDALEPTRQRHAGPWELQYNPLRTFRPPRNASAVIEAIRAPFNPQGFNFNKPFLRRESFWEGALQGHQVSLLYNKFPFVELHGLLVPDRKAELPQFLDEAYHHFVWALTEQLGDTLPGVGFGYNAFGAYASVNHLHFQMFARETGLPITDARWQHNGGTQPYPLTCHRLDTAETAWAFIHRLHAENTAYNLLYLPGRLYCIPRRKQGSYRHAAWTGGYAWYEVCGGAVVTTPEDFDTLEHVAIEAEFAKLRLQD